MMKKSARYFVAMSVAFVTLTGACRKAPEPAAVGVAEAEAKPAPAGTVSLTPESVKGGGIAVEAARMIDAARTVRALGEFEFDPRRMAEVSARTAGRIERLSANLGDRVAAGQVLAEIYSPDYLSLQAEVLLAGERAVRLKGDPDGPSAASFLDASRKKLLPLGLIEADIDALLSSRSIRPTLALRTPIPGVVIAARAITGGQVDPASTIFQIADPSVLRACVHIYEKDLVSVRTGLESVLTTQAYPGLTFKGRLVFIGATMDDKTRTIEGRIEVANPDGRLKPGMFVEASLRTLEGRSALIVPEGAVQEVQAHPAVFVRTGPTTFVLRPVETGARADGAVEITKGLADGEMVVTAGAFLLKSELLKKSLGD
jgi:multidrug efflux pump subunit AcrA (membrane-fusion protein)